MDTEQVVTRFEAERQALALMDHPSIARVFDAGATDTGRPYFVMELVKGVPITEYCDTVHLTPKDRLQLFVPVCQAIQHAHQKGIIHRDVKPSNVLVTMQDGKPVPKIIDFGIAKATELRLTERSLFTQYGTIMGTLEYMSPEQAEMSAMDVDTRTDVYALGVMLYELLTGSTPLERSRLRQAGYEEILRRIREEEPPRPSTRLSESRQRLASVAAQRRTEPARLTKLVRGELDWIVMKAIEKDRTRRYETANGFARDIERYLAGDPVEAGPPSASYRLRKYARKHRGALVTAGAFAVLLAAASAVSTWQAVRATVAESTAHEEAAKAKAVNEFLTQDILTQAEPANNSAEDHVELLDVLDRAALKVGDRFRDQPQVEADLRGTIAATYHGLGSFAKAERQVRAQLEIERRLQSGDSAPALNALGQLGHFRNHLGDSREAVDLLQRAAGGLSRTLGPDHPDTLASRNNLALAYLAAGRTSDAIEMHAATLKLTTSKLGPDHLDTLRTQANLGVNYRDAGRPAEGVRLMAEALERAKGRDDALAALAFVPPQLGAIYEAAGRTAEAISMRELTLRLCMSRLGPDHPDTLTSRNDLAASYWKAGRLDRSVPLFEQTLKLSTAKLGPDHAATLLTQVNLGINYRDAGRPAEGARLIEQALERAKGRPDALAALAFVPPQGAAAYEAAGQFAKSEPLYRIGLERVRKQFGPNDLRTAGAMASLGLNLLKQQKWTDAEPMLRECMAIREKGQPGVWSTFNARSMLGGSLLGQKKYAEAEPLVLSGYEGLNAREAKIPASGKSWLTEAGERVVKLYEEWGHPAEAREWRKKLGLKAPELPSDVFAR